MTFLRNPELLNEDYRVSDLIGIENYVSKFADNFKQVPDRSIIGFVGQYGSGKSTLLYQMKEVLEKEEYIWIHFDAWKYPERNNLWDGFVLEFATQINEFIEAKAQLDGESKISNIFINLASIAGKAKQVPFVDETANILKEIFSRSPATRVIEYQETLNYLFGAVVKKHLHKKVIITVEDVDRSGDKGLLFLETLHLYLSTLKEIEVKVIAPISNTSFQSHTESYTKCIDYFEFFSPKHSSFEKFVDSIFLDSDTLIENYPFFKESLEGHNYKNQLSFLFYELFTLHPEIVTLRFLKMIIRKGNVRFKAMIDKGITTDFRLWIVAEISRYLPSSHDHRTNMHQDIQTYKGITGSPLKEFINLMYHKLPNIEALESNMIKMGAIKLSSIEFSRHLGTRHDRGSYQIIVPIEYFTT